MSADAEEGLLAATGGELAECENCQDAIPARWGSGALCETCEQEQEEVQTATERAK